MLFMIMILHNQQCFVACMHFVHLTCQGRRIPRTSGVKRNGNSEFCCSNDMIHSLLTMTISRVFDSQDLSNTLVSSPPKFCKVMCNRLIVIWCSLLVPVLGHQHLYSQLRYLSTGSELPDAGKEWPAGSPWPLPWSYLTTTILFTFDTATFRITGDALYGEKCDPLDFAIKKYNNAFLFPSVHGIHTKPDSTLPLIDELKVSIVGDRNSNGTTECQNYPRLIEVPYFGEHYTLIVGHEDGNMAEIVAETVWGALRGIETFSQLIWSNEHFQEGIVHFYINRTTIEDFPRFPHRGVMIDTARHYLPERIFYDIMDGMLYNKLNVLHWHIVDDQSFPYVSKRFPELSNQGAFTRRHVYFPEAICRIIEAGRLRGIRVIFEFDSPGHSESWGRAFPELLSPCPVRDSNNKTGTKRENMNPTSESTYKFLRDFFREVIKEVSKDKSIHLGIDEVSTACWESSPQIAQFMKQQKLSNHKDLLKYYADRLIAVAKGLGAKPIIVWQDPLDMDIQFADPEILIVQVWKDWGLHWTEHLQKVLDMGYKAIVSAPWYLNYIDYGETWTKYYKADPILSLPHVTDEQKNKIMGGEAAIWGEYVDSTNILPRLFPSVGAVAERLWSHGIGIKSSDISNARNRLDQLRCRLLRRGIPAQPIFNGYCGTWEIVT